MPALKRVPLQGKITWLGRVADRDAGLAAAPVDQVDADLAGIVGESHSGETRAACVRVEELYAEGTEIRNVRQLSVLSQEELAAIGAEMGIASLDPGWIGASMVVSGIPDFSHLPPSSRLQAPSGATLVVDMANRPCTLPARVIEADAPGKGHLFKPAARGRRGVTAWVERPGVFRRGDTLSIFVPDQRAWNADP